MSYACAMICLERYESAVTMQVRRSRLEGELSDDAEVQTLQIRVLYHFPKLHVDRVWQLLLLCRISQKVVSKLQQPGCRRVKHVRVSLMWRAYRESTFAYGTRFRTVQRLETTATSGGTNAPPSPAHSLGE